MSYHGLGMNILGQEFDLVGNIQAELNTAVENSLANAASGPTATSFKNQFVVALVVQTAIILGGMYLIERYAGRQ